MSTTRTYELGGGKYTAVQNDDGSNTWNILDVPICGEIRESDVKGNPKPIDKAWLEGAVERHQERLKSDNFKPPLHLEHHEPGVKTERAGEFIPRRVGKLQYNGQPTAVIFADLTRVPDHIFQRIEKGELPYLSVELGSWDDGEFTSLALMDDDAPFFRFPNLTIGDKVVATTAAAEKLVEPIGVAQAFASTAKGALVLCKAFSGTRLSDDDKDEKKDDGGGVTDEKKDESAEEKPATETEEKPEAQAKAGDGAPTDEASTGAVTLGDLAVTLKQILTTLTVLAKSQTGVGAVTASTETDDDKAPVEQERPMDDKEKKLAAETEIKLNARVAALEVEREDRKKQDALKALAAKGEADLKGWHLTDSHKAALLKAAEKGEDMVKLFVDTFKTSVPKDPPKSFESFESGAGVASGDPESDKVVQLYASRGPEALEMARQFVSMHAESKRLGMTRLSAEEYVAAQFKGRAAQATVALNGRTR